MAFALNRRRTRRTRRVSQPRAADPVDEGSAAPALKLPHEHDENTDETGRTSDRGAIAQAADDLAAGLVDTDCHGTPGLPPAGGAKRGKT